MAIRRRTRIKSGSTGLQMPSGYAASGTPGTSITQGTKTIGGYDSAGSAFTFGGRTTPTKQPMATGAQATPSALGLSFQVDPNQSAIDKASQNLLNSYGTRLPDQKKVRRDVLSQFQGEIDSLDRASAQERANIASQFAAIGKSRTGVDTAIQARRGLQGSDFGAAQTDRVISQTEGEKAQATAQSDLRYESAKQSLYTQARTMAEAAYENKLNAYRQGAGATVTYLQNKQAMAADNANKIVKQALLNDIDLTKPEFSVDLGVLAKQVGTTPDNLKMVYQEQKSAMEAAQAEEARKRYVEDRSFGLDMAKEDREVGRLNFDIEKFNQEFQLDSAKTMAEINKINFDIANGGQDEVLDYATAEKLGLPYGSTKAQAIGLIPGQEKRAEEAQLALDKATNLNKLINDLLLHPGLQGATGGNRLKTALPTGLGGRHARDFVARFDQLKAALRLENIKLLKGTGSISDSEQRMLEEASTSLRRDQNAEDIILKLQEMQEATINSMNKNRNLVQVNQTNTALNQIDETFDSTIKPQSVNINDLRNNKGLDFQQVGNTLDSKVKSWSQSVPKLQIESSNFKKIETIPTISNLTPKSKMVAAATVEKFPDGSKGGQCGVWVRKVATNFGYTYPALGDGLKSKIAAVQKYGTSINNAKPGSVIVTKENPTYGHVAWIIGRNDKGFIVAESNYKRSETVSYGRVIPFNSDKIVGIINPTKKS